MSVRNGMVMVRRGDGAIVASAFYNLFTSFHEHISNKRLKEALSLCRIAQVIFKFIPSLYINFIIRFRSNYNVTCNFILPPE